MFLHFFHNCLYFHELMLHQTIIGTRLSHNQLKLDEALQQNLGDLWTSMIVALSPCTRSVRNRAVPLILGAIGGPAAHVYRRVLDKERKHISNVRQVMRKYVGVGDCRHDYSKVYAGVWLLVCTLSFSRYVAGCVWLAIHSACGSLPTSYKRPHAVCNFWSFSVWFCYSCCI
jgi:hypothetical protein